MEDAKKTITTSRPESKEEERNVDPGCPFWFFGDKSASIKDLENRVEVIDA